MKPIWINYELWEDYKNGMYLKRCDETIAQQCLDLFKSTKLKECMRNVKAWKVSATIQFNRARGTHQILDMSKLVSDLFLKGQTDAEIMESLGMEKDEVIRLKQISGLKEAFSNHEFSNSWTELLEKIDIQDDVIDEETEVE